MEATTQYFGKWFFINRSQNFIALLNFYDSHLGVKITGPYCPACWPIGTNEVKQCPVRKKKKILCTEVLEQPKQGKDLLYRHDQPNEPPQGRTPFINMCSLSPHLPLFQQSKGVTHLQSLCARPPILSRQLEYASKYYVDGKT